MPHFSSTGKHVHKHKVTGKWVTTKGTVVKHQAAVTTVRPKRKTAKRRTKKK